MENNFQPTPNREEDKTIVFSSDEKAVPGNKDDKTTVSNTSQIPVTPVSDQDAIPSIDEVKNKLDAAKKNKGFSGGAMAAGIAGAGIAGAALGTVYSEEIKDAVSGVADSLTSGEAEADTDSGSTSGNWANLTSFVTETTEPGDTSDNNSAVELEYADNGGNVYNVSFIDSDGNGIFDEQSGSIDFADGSSLSIIQSGENLPSLFTSGLDYAAPQDYAQHSGAFMFAAENNETHIYEIQAGDTLSEIALDHNTSIEHILELNPDISNPDLIYAGDQIEIPTNDNITNPYETSSEAITYGMGENGINEQTGNDVASFEGDEGSLSQTGEFDQVDWASFSDEGVSPDQSDYSDQLANTDFDSFEIPDSYTDTYGYESFDGSEFM